MFKSMLAADMLEKITGKIKLPDVSLKTGRQLRLNIDASFYHVRFKCNPQSNELTTGPHELVQHFRL